MFDVAETRTRPGRLDPDGDKFAYLLRRLCGQGQGFLKCCAIGNDMIGGKHQHRGGVIPGCDPTGAERDRCGRVALGRLGDDILLGKVREEFTNCPLLLRVRQD